MIIIGIGANLRHPSYGPPRRTCGAALDRLEQHAGVKITMCSPWYQSSPVHRTPDEDLQMQPWYVNAAAALETTLSPETLLRVLQKTEHVFDRIRSVEDAPRTLDLDIIAYNDRTIETPDLVVPHPRLESRAFVVFPLMDIAPNWVHPQTGQRIAVLRENLAPDQSIEPMDPVDGLYGTEWSSLS